MLSRDPRGLEIKGQEYESAVADLKGAIRLDPRDPAGKFECWPKTPLDEDALRYGREQVRRMLKDRPMMAGYGEKAEPVYAWAARKFAGEDSRERIAWDDSPPFASPLAESDFNGRRIRLGTGAFHSRTERASS